MEQACANVACAQSSFLCAVAQGAFTKQDDQVDLSSIFVIQTEQAVMQAVIPVEAIVTMEETVIIAMETVTAVEESTIVTTFAVEITVTAISAVVTIVQFIMATVAIVVHAQTAQSISVETIIPVEVVASTIV